jgi:hypothetical protein
MKHASTRAVFEYWNRLRANRPAPERGDIDPAAIRHALGDTFMLSADFVDHLVFRLAGTRVCALFGRELKGEPFDALWADESRAAIDDLLTAVTKEAAGAVAGLVGRTDDGDATDIEMLLLPLAHGRHSRLGPRGNHGRVRALGVLAPMPPPYWLGAKPVSELELTGLRHIGAEVRDRGTVFGREPARLRHGFVVYSGGRETASGEQVG